MRFINKIIIFILSFVITSCEKDKFTLLDTNYNAPSISKLILSKYIIDTDTIKMDNQTSVLDTITITNTVSVLVDDVDGLQDIKEVYIKTENPNSSKSVYSGNLKFMEFTTEANKILAKYSDTLSFKITRQVVGDFYVLCEAIDNNNLTSNVLITSFTITRSGEPPVISDLNAPDTVNLPTSGSSIILFSIKATDPNNDIKEVYFRSLDSSDPHKKFYMYDNGDLRNNGDTSANDGIYSILIQLPYNMTPKSYRFEFEASDYTEYLSNKIIHTLTVIKP